MVGTHLIIILGNCRQPGLLGPVNLTRKRLLAMAALSWVGVPTMPGSNISSPSRGVL
jgi:hypothetical protein